MKTVRLIDAIVRQTAILVADLATFGAERLPLGHIPDQMFSELVRALDSPLPTMTCCALRFGFRSRVTCVPKEAL